MEMRKMHRDPDYLHATFLVQIFSAKIFSHQDNPGDSLYMDVLLLARISQLYLY